MIQISSQCERAPNALPRFHARSGKASFDAFLIVTREKHAPPDLRLLIIVWAEFGVSAAWKRAHLHIKRIRDLQNPRPDRLG